MRNHWILAIYSFMISLFPKRYQEEFGEELLYAVRMELEEAQGKGQLFVTRLAWRELRDLPGACIQAYIRERRGLTMKLQPGAHLPDGPFKLWQLGALFLPLSISLVMVALDQIRGYEIYLICGIGILLLGLLVIVWINGFMKAFPIWALPSLGLIFFFFGSGFSYIARAITLIALRPLWGGYWPDSIFIRLLMYIWFDLMYVAITASFMMILLALSKSLLQLARNDWTLLSFLAYSMVIPSIIFSGDEYHGLAPYQLGSVLILIAGIVLFVLLPSRWSRLLVLLTATLVAPVTVSLGVYRIFPAQDFAVSILSFRVWEAIQPVLELPALLVIMCLPVFVSRLPASYGHKFHITATT